MRPLIHFWGVHPANPAALESAINAAGLQPSQLVCERLAHYKSIIPLDNAQFQAHANAFFGGAVPPGGDPDYGSGWYNIWLPQYNETHGALAQESMQAIIDLYFPDGCPTDTPSPVVTVNSATICPGESATLTASGAMYYQWSTGETGHTITVSPDSTTTYSVIGKTAGFYAAPVSAEVTVNPIPVVSLNNASICEGQSATLTASGAETYVWSNGASGESISVSPTETTTFTVTGTTAGCAAAPVTAQVTVNPLPSVTITTDQQGQYTLLDATGPGLTYLWSTGELTSSIQVNTSGVYTVTVTNDAGCSAASSVSVTVISAVKDPYDGIKITIAPNPVTDILNIMVSGSSTTNIRILDKLGRVVVAEQTFIPDGTASTLNVALLPAGAYYLQVTGTNFVRTVRMVK